MKDYQTAKERLSNPYRKLLREGVKDTLLVLTCCVIFLFLLTQPNGVI